MLDIPIYIHDKIVSYYKCEIFITYIQFHFGNACVGLVLRKNSGEE